MKKWLALTVMTAGIVLARLGNLANRLYSSSNSTIIRRSEEGR